MLIAVALILTCSGEAVAVIPRPHRCEIIITAVDPSTRTLFAESIEAHPGILKFRWPRGSLVETATGAVDPRSLSPGQRLRISHRRPLFGPWWLTRLRLLAP